LRPEQVTNFNKIKKQMKGWNFNDPGGVKDGTVYYLYHNGRCAVWGNDEYYDNFPPAMQESIISMLEMAGIKNLMDEFNANNWYDPLLKMPQD
jgi:hypothetical protein